MLFYEVPTQTTNLSSSISAHRAQPPSPAESALPLHPTSVDSKPLTKYLTPSQSTLTKNTGVGGPLPSRQKQKPRTKAAASSLLPLSPILPLPQSFFTVSHPAKRIQSANLAPSATPLAHPESPESNSPPPTPLPHLHASHPGSPN